MTVVSGFELFGEGFDLLGFLGAFQTLGTGSNIVDIFPDEGVWVRDTGNNSAKLYDKNGTLIEDIPLQQNSNLYAVTTDELVGYYFGSTSNAQIVVHDRQGTVKLTIPMAAFTREICAASENRYFGVHWSGGGQPNTIRIYDKNGTLLESDLVPSNTTMIFPKNRGNYITFYLSTSTPPGANTLKILTDEGDYFEIPTPSYLIL